MKKGLCEMVFILDRSGSMSGLEKDTIGGFNAMIEKQKKQAGTALVSTVFFNQYQQVVLDRVALEEVSNLTLEDYVPQGMTALLDAMGNAIKHIGNIHKYAREEDVPEHTIFVITTDGYENASRHYSSSEVKKMVERQKEKYGWEFLFLGANIDAVNTAQTFGINEDHAVEFVCDSIGTEKNFSALDQAITTLRNNNPLKRNWKKSIEDDHQARKNK